jgi:type IV pilus assembly protein PilA
MIRNKGFTLIELMIVIAILGILLAIAIPAYQDYTVRTRTSECFNLQAPVKLQISEFYISNGSMPVSADVTPNRTTPYCRAGAYLDTQRTVDQADILIQVDGDGVGAPGALDFDANMTAYGCFEQNGDVEWTCHYQRAVLTNYNGRFLPASRRLATDPGRSADCTTNR